MVLIRILALIAMFSLTGCELASSIASSTSFGTTTNSSSTSSTITGRAVSLDGQPISGASVTTSSGQTVTDQEGWFKLPSTQEPQWITVEHESFISRTRAAAPGSPVLVRLTPDDGKTIALHFTGDVMFGRRFYDPNEDGDTSDGLLAPNSEAEEHMALLRHVRPLLENADLTVVNLESPLLDQPYIDPRRRRPARFHSTKDYVFASAPAAAVALKQVGVDVVDLANNHIYDGLEQGILDTADALNQAGFQDGEGYFGAGVSEQEAWTPAVTTIRGQTVAFLGCTTLTGSDHPISYVASDDQRKGGAAHCDEVTIRALVQTAQEKHDIVIFMIHGGSEYKRSPTDLVQRMTTAAREAGATLVVNHHPHVVGGFDWDGSSLVAWTLGNFLFDQTVWPTFESYLLSVHLRDGKVIQAYTEPLIIDGYVPKGITGDLANFVARGAAGREAGPFLVENGAMELDVSNNAIHHQVKLPVAGDSQVGQIFRIAHGWWVNNFSGLGSIRLGRDLLWVGGFDDEIADETHQGGRLWQPIEVDQATGSIGSEYAYEGNAGVRLQRRGFDDSDMMLTPLHRIPVQVGSDLSVVGMVRAHPDASITLQLSWYSQLSGEPQARQWKRITVEDENTWTPFRFDVTVPPHTAAAGFYFRLQPPDQGAVTADFDNIRVIEWESDINSFSPQYQYIQVFGAGEVSLQKDILPGAEQWANLNNSVKLVPIGK